MKTMKFIFAALIVCTACVQNPKHQFNYSEPEQMGFSSVKLDSLKIHLEESGASSMLLLVKGEVIFDWGSTDRKHTIHSIRKCLLNSLFGIAVSEGIIDTAMTLRELEIDDIDPGLSGNELDARIIDLLKSRSGVYHRAAAVSEGMLRAMPERDSHLPGEHFYYNNWDFNVLGFILEQKTGKSIYDLFMEQIAIPLGMHDYQGKYTTIDAEEEGVEIPDTDGFYQYEKSKSKYPAYHFRMSARDLALYGQLYLQKGEWEGTQIVPADWIEVSTYPWSVYNPDYGLARGMLWGVILPRDEQGTSSYYHTGAGIHMLGVYPASGLVLVHRVDTENDYSYQQSDIYKMIDLVFNAKTNEHI
ncbi:MAG: serine hydrolase [Bacteroidota bacterium]|nr:serine hydrolase [Bacteroidota bacterium]